VAKTPRVVGETAEGSGEASGTKQLCIGAEQLQLTKPASSCLHCSNVCHKGGGMTAHSRKAVDHTAAFIKKVLDRTAAGVCGCAGALHAVWAAADGHDAAVQLHYQCEAAGEGLIASHLYCVCKQLTATFMKHTCVWLYSLGGPWHVNEWCSFTV
jgi:hypothetical protein